MCKVCDARRAKTQGVSRRDFMKTTAVSGLAVAAAAVTTTGSAVAQEVAGPPRDTGMAKSRYVIRGGDVLSVDPAVGDFAGGDVLVEGNKIIAVAQNIDAGDAEVIDATGKIVMPGFVDTHHHMFETALRSFLTNGLLFNDGLPHGEVNYFDYILGKFAGVYTPQDVYISEIYGSLSQLDAGVTTVHDVSQISHTPEHTDAAISGIADSGRRAVFGYFEGQGDKTMYPTDIRRIREQYFSSKDQLMTLVMGGEIYLPDYDVAWNLGRELDLPVACHVVGSFMADTFAELGRRGRFGPDNLFIHMTGISDEAWKMTADSGAGVSLAVPIEMNMRHGMPPIAKSISLGIEPSLSSDVECTMTADFFTQMRSTMTLQRALVNDAALSGGTELPDLLTCADVIRFATLRGAEHLWLGDKVGSLTPGKEADIVLLSADAINVAPLNNVPGAVVSLMERSNVDTVIVAGKVRKWQGALLDVDLPKLTNELTESRDRLFKAAGLERDLFGS